MATYYLDANRVFYKICLMKFNIIFCFIKLLRNIMSISFVKVLQEIQAHATRGVLHSFDEDIED